MGSGEPAGAWVSAVGDERDRRADERAGVGVAFDAMAFHQHDAILRRGCRSGDRDRRRLRDQVALQRQSLPLAHQAARANEPRHSAQRHSTLVIL